MATWDEIAAQMKDHYTVKHEAENLILVEMTLSSGRLQDVSLQLLEVAAAPGNPLLQMFSPFADAAEDSIDLRSALSHHTEGVGLAIQSDLLGYVWSWPIKNLDPIDLHLVLRLLMNHADGKEELSLDRDRF